MLKIRLTLMLILVALIGCSKQSFKIIDILPIINLEAGIEKNIIISDLFYSDHYNLTFVENKNIKTEFDSKSLVLKLTADKNFEGGTTLEFSKDDKTYSIPINCFIKPIAKFSFRPKKNYKEIFVFGEFNDWRRSEIPLTDENKDGVFEKEISVEPGSYQYRFLVDGEEIVDKANPNKIENGKDHYNSVVIAEPRFSSTPFLHVLNFEDTGESTQLNFKYTPEDAEIQTKNVIGLVDNFNLAADQIKVNNNLISLSFNKEQLAGKKHLRVAVTKSGQTTNYKNIILFDGKPLDNSNDTWFDGVMYSVLIDRFKDGDKSINQPVVNDSVDQKANYNGGDLQGVVEKLNDGYFEDLGINIIWISPVYDNPNKAYQEYPAPHRWYSGYHGYWPIDPYRIEENFGDMAKLKELIKTAHTKKIKVLLDFVSNHVHKEHIYYKNHKDWFGKLELEDGRKNLRFWDEFRLTTWFEPYLPSFDLLGSKQALEQLTDDAIWWLKETGADGFRHDAVKHVPNEFWRLLTKKINKEVAIPENKYVYQVGETFGSYDMVSSYVNNGQLSSQFNFNLYNVAQTAFIDPNTSFKFLDEDMQRTFKYYGNLHYMVNIMDSHDKNRYIAYADGDLDLSQWSAIEEGWNNPPKVDKPSSYKKAELYLAYMNSIPGLPVIYYGSEFGMTGASDPDNRRMMRFDDQLSENENQMLKNVQELVKLRRKHTALRQGDFYTVQADKNIFAYIRSDMNERILVVLNKNEKEKVFELNIPAFYNSTKAVDIKTNDTVTVDKSIKVSIDGIGWKMYSLEK
ncbi:MAG: alpha-glucosidase C-terminal domain-containing protein [Melioribacteraceae bacterium]|nr:alpha-glucosidase C-terminal domain-containing protein [Melioribacteraceae bacterium]